MGRKALVTLLGFTLASCGNGGSGSNAGAGTTATSSPTTTNAYSTYAQLTGDQTFKTSCSAFRYDYSPPAPQAVVAFGSGLTLGYTAATQTYLITPNAQDTGYFGTQSRSYGPADRDTTSTSTTVSTYARTTNGFSERLMIGPTASAGTTPDYARGFLLRVPLFGIATSNPPAALYYCVYGVPTRTDDLPTSAFQYTRTGLNGTATAYPAGAASEGYSVTQSTLGFNVDVPGNRVTVTIHLLGALVTASGTSSTTVDLGTYTGTAAIDRTGSYSGQLTSANRTIQSASFTGWFFGPQAGEGAFSLAIDAADLSAGRRIGFLGTGIALK